MAAVQVTYKGQDETCYVATWGMGRGRGRGKGVLGLGLGLRLRLRGEEEVCMHKTVV